MAYVFWHSTIHSFWHLISHLFWHSIWHSIWHSLPAFYLAFYLTFRCPASSGAGDMVFGSRRTLEHPELRYGVQRSLLSADRRQEWQRTKEGGRKEGKKEAIKQARKQARRVAPLWKSRDPHLAGEEKPGTQQNKTKNSFIGQINRPDTEFILKGAAFNFSRRFGIPSEGRHGDSQGSDTFHCQGPF